LTKHLVKRSGRPNLTSSARRARIASSEKVGLRPRLPDSAAFQVVPWPNQTIDEPRSCSAAS
jgi:hypothetical protein